MFKKLFVSSALFGLVYGFITNYGELVGENNLSLMDRAIITKMDPKHGVIMALLAVGLYLVLSYGKSEKCIQKLRKEYLDQNGFENEADLSNIEYRSMLDYVDSHKGMKKPLKLCLVIGIVLSAIFVSQPVKLAYDEGLTLYNEQLALEEQRAKEAEAAYNAPFQDQVLYLEGLPPINVVSGNTFKTGDVNTYIDTYVRSQPAVLLNRCVMINLCDENNMNYFKQTHDMSLDDDAYAFASSDDMNIFVPLNLTDYDQETVTHELTHIFDYSMANGYTSYMGVSVRQDFMNYFNENPMLFREYSSHDPAEFFADAGDYYVNFPEEFKAKNESLFFYMNNWMGLY